MKGISKCSPLAILTASLRRLGILFSLPGSIQARSKDIQLIEITAKKYEYSNSPIHVKIGTKFNSRPQSPTTIMASKLELFPMAPNRMARQGDVVQ